MTCEINYVADDERYETLTMRGVTLCRTEPAAIQDSFSTRLSYFPSTALLRAKVTKTIFETLSVLG